MFRLRQRRSWWCPVSTSSSTSAASQSRRCASIKIQLPSRTPRDTPDRTSRICWRPCTRLHVCWRWTLFLLVKLWGEDGGCLSGVIWLMPVLFQDSYPFLEFVPWTWGSRASRGSFIPSLWLFGVKKISISIKTFFCSFVLVCKILSFFCCSKVKIS